MREPTSPQRTSPSGGKEEKTLLGVRIPQSFHRRVQSECQRRELSLQDMVVDALKFYFRTPAKWDYAAMTVVRHGEEDEELPNEEVARRNAWMGLAAKYVNSMPPDKIEMLKRVMEWDLLAQRTSRRKSVRRKPQPARQKE
jgi:hypothetical protein